MFGPITGREGLRELIQGEMLTTSTPSPYLQQQDHHGPHPHLLPIQDRAIGPEEVKIWGLVMDLTNPASRETALLELSKKREQYEDLALVLWHSFGAFWF